MERPLQPIQQIAANDALSTQPMIPPPLGLMLLHTLVGHTDWVTCVAWSPNGKWLASSSYDKTVRLWDPANRTLLHVLIGHADRVSCVAWSPDGKWLASSSYDKTVRLWDPANRTLLHTLVGHTNWVTYVAWSPDGKWLASSSYDKTVRLWDPANRTLLHVLIGHVDWVSCVAWSPDGKQIVSSSYDGTVRLWDSTTGMLLHTLEGHMGAVVSAIWSPDGQLLASVSYENEPFYDADVCLWRTDTWETVVVHKGLRGFAYSAWHPVFQLLECVGPRKGEIAVWRLDLGYLLRGGTASPETIHYTNAKVVLVGDSGVGKTGLGLVLSGQSFTWTPSTHGRYVWNFAHQEVSLDKQRRETRETLLWDLAGQPGYRLIHQLHLDEIAVALVVFDAHSETDPFAGVQYWDRALRSAQRIQGGTALPLKKFLVAARTDRGGVGASSERIQSIIQELGFDGYFATSAQEGWQVDELRAAIYQAIDWLMLPKVSSTVFFHQIKQFLLDKKKRARQLISSVEDLYNAFLHSQGAPQETSDLAQFETCIGRVESTGLIKRLSFGKLVLIQPELLDAYGSALINAVKEEPDGLGSIAERKARTGNFRVPSAERMQDKEQEQLLLIAMIEDLLRRELALHEGGMLVFPSQSTKEYPDLPDPQGKAVVFLFEGPVLNIYATLAVRLARSGVFKKQDLWKNAVTYTTSLGGTCGLYLRNVGEGRGELTLFFDQVISREMRHAFTEYVHLYLLRGALPASVSVRSVLVCDICSTVINDYIIQRRKARNIDWLNCPVCETRISLAVHDLQFTAATSLRAKEMDQAADIRREREAAQPILQGKIVTSDFDVFMCHNTLDKPIVKQISKQLKEQGILPWLDEWELRPGLPWQQLLGQQIEHIKTAAVFVGKDGIGPWHDQELNAFLVEFVRRGCPVIPVLLPDAPHEPKLPVFLRSMTWVDFRLQEPDPLQRLLWGITGKRDLE